jgi:hypothetical protein
LTLTLWSLVEVVVVVVVISDTVGGSTRSLSHALSEAARALRHTEGGRVGGSHAHRQTDAHARGRTGRYGGRSRIGGDRCAGRWALCGGLPGTRRALNTHRRLSQLCWRALRYMSAWRAS